MRKRNNKNRFYVEMKMFSRKILMDTLKIYVTVTIKMTFAERFSTETCNKPRKRNNKKIFCVQIKFGSGKIMMETFENIRNRKK